MAVSSMTGFARTEGAGEASSWFWELRSVNGKGFDLRLRLPPGLEALEPKLRALAVERFTRGTVHASLTMTRQQGAVEVRLNEAVLQQVVKAAKRAAELTGGTMPDTSSLLGLRGVLEIAETEAGSALAGIEGEALIADFARALGELQVARRSEGERLKVIVADQIDEIERLTEKVEISPARSVEAIRARIGEQLVRLAGSEQKFDPDRLHQEAVLIATRADVEEELKRLSAHVAAGRDLLNAGGAIGRKFDFLAQEFQREANTLCSKSNDVAITEAGLALKVRIDQMREQVQNLE
ncbi:MAG: YicC family protein [Alphaproteobacteria bacterium]|nr:YicC family protein [Alphaproteobacteria bacterium]